MKALAERKKTTKQKVGRTKQTGTIQKAKRRITSKAKAPPLPKGAKPSPLVNRPSGFRKGRGFSLLELQGARVLLAHARQLRLPIDLRRGTQYDVNIKAIRDWNITPKSPEPTKKTPKQSSKKRAKKATKG